jgi:hypothetical protein
VKAPEVLKTDVSARNRSVRDQRSEVRDQRSDCGLHTNALPLITEREGIYYS